MAKFGSARTYVAIPLLNEAQLVGTIIIYRQEVRPFTDTHIELLTTFAAQAVIAIENARLLNELRQRTNDLSEALQQQTATSEVLRGHLKLTPVNLSRSFNAILENATRICEAKFGTLYRYAGGEFYPVTFHKVPSSFADFLCKRGSFVPPSQTPLDRLLRAKEVIRTAFYSAAEIPSPSARLAGAKSHIAVPMFKDN